ncbi:MAG: SPOR domain-containing protein [Candidatus Omnitrophica bacterium]|nr:SPOR domain-containing protein [Candidatus Omnitrophota bacterium]
MQTDLFNAEPVVRETPGESRFKRLKSFFDRFVEIRMDRLIMIILAFLLLAALAYSFGFERGVSVTMEKGKEFLIREVIESEKPQLLPTAVSGKASPAAVTVLPKPTPPKFPQAAPLQKGLVAAKTALGVSSAKPSLAAPKTSVPTVSIAAGVNETAADKPYTIQLITYSARDKAQSEIDALSAKGFKGFIIPSGKYFVVCAGYYASSAEASQALRTLKANKSYADAYVRKLNR